MKQAFMGARKTMIMGGYTDFLGVMPLVSIVDLSHRLPKVAGPSSIDKEKAAARLVKYNMKFSEDRLAFIGASKRVLSIYEGRDLNANYKKEMKEALENLGAASPSFVQKLVGIQSAAQKRVAVLDGLEKTAMGGAPHIAHTNVREALNSDMAAVIGLSHRLNNIVAGTSIVVDIAARSNGSKEFPEAHAEIVKRNLSRFENVFSFLDQVDASKVVVKPYMVGMSIFVEVEPGNDK